MLQRAAAVFSGFPPPPDRLDRRLKASTEKMTHGCGDTAVYRPQAVPNPLPLCVCSINMLSFNIKVCKSKQLPKYCCSAVLASL